MARRVVIVKRPVVRVSDEVLELFSDPSKVKVWCVWCDAPKSNCRKPCEICGYHGNSSQPRSVRSGVFVELIKG